MTPEEVSAARQASRRQVAHSERAGLAEAALANFVDWLEGDPTNVIMLEATRPHLLQRLRSLIGRATPPLPGATGGILDGPDEWHLSDVLIAVRKPSGDIVLVQGHHVVSIHPDLHGVLGRALLRGHERGDRW